MEQTISQATRPLSGTVRVPGDKSLSHRAVLFAAMAAGTSVVSGVLESADVRSTIGAVRDLGAEVEIAEATDGSLTCTITGWGPLGPDAPVGPIECGNSGTTARLLLGMLAGWSGPFTLTGDASLSRRPMDRVTRPVSAMGAVFDSSGETLPITISGGSLKPLVYESPVASAQVKTALLLAGLRASGRTLVREPAPSRDHTERLLPAFSVPVGRDEAARSCWVDGPGVPKATQVDVPGDPSSAAFLVAAALLVSGSEVVIDGVALNPTRIGYLKVLERMGAAVAIVPGSCAGAEPVGAIAASGDRLLVATDIPAEEVPSLVDEIPVLALLATQAVGTTRFEGVAELRVKESDRLAAIVEGLSALGATAYAEGDTLIVTGPTPLHGASLLSLGDHRLAMTWALAGLVSTSAVIVSEFEAIEVSYPGFLDDLKALGVSSG